MLIGKTNILVASDDGAKGRVVFHSVKARVLDRGILRQRYAHNSGRKTRLFTE